MRAVYILLLLILSLPAISQNKQPAGKNIADTLDLSKTKTESEVLIKGSARREKTIALISYQKNTNTIFGSLVIF